jgi:hypothetical protein
VYGSYLSQYHVRGNVWNLYSNVETEKKIIAGSFIHSVAAGATWQYDVNRGEGRVYDPEYPPPTSTYTGDRPRSYDSLPGMTNVGLFAEDNVSGTFFLPMTLQLGARYQMFNPRSVNFSGLFTKKDFVNSAQGSYLDPRINLRISITENTQLRLGYGVTSKSPPLASIYPNPKYFDIADTVSVNTSDRSKDFAIVSTYKYNLTNTALHGYRQNKYEASLDQRIGDGVGLSVTGYINETNDGVYSQELPVILTKRSWPQWPDQSVSYAKDTLMESVYIATNGFHALSKGVEASVRTRRLPVINTVIQVDGSYTYYESTVPNGVDYGAERTDALLGKTVIPMYHTIGQYSKDLLLKYRFDVLLERLHMWFTLNIEQQPVEIDGYIGKADSLAIGYLTASGETVTIPQTERGSAQFANIRRTVKAYQLLEENRPNRWLVNVRVSKELWEGTEASFFVNNLWNSRPLYRLKRTDAGTYTYEQRNPPLYFGLECSMVF